MEVHESTRTREDYSSFRVKAWCFNPDGVLPCRDLVIMEPPSGAAGVPPVKLGLVYPIKLAVRLDTGGGGALSPPASDVGDQPPPDEGHGSENGRARHRCRTSASSPAPAGPALVDTLAGAVPAGGARGCDASGVAHVAAVDASDPLPQLRNPRRLPRRRFPMN